MQGKGKNRSLYYSAVGPEEDYVENQMDSKLQEAVAKDLNQVRLQVLWEVVL